MPGTAAVYARPEFHPALADLSDSRLLREHAYVDGRWTSGDQGKSFVVTDPASGLTLAYVASLGTAETTRAIDAAEMALPAWRAMLPQERTVILKRWHDLILAAREDLALIMTLEQGKPLGESWGEIGYAASFVDYYAEEAKRCGVEGVSSHLPNAQMTLTRVPLGVVGLVTPWNFPSAMLTRKAAAALAAGCTVVAHPSAETPFSALALAVLAERAGVPAGVFNVVTGDAATIVGRLCQDRRVRAMSFTGSTEVGRLIAAQSAPTVKRLIMELGGHAPMLIFADADIERAVGIAMDAKFATSGQDCLAANRIYVERPIYERFLAAFGRRIEALKVGAGLVAGTEIGPLMHERAVAKVETQVKDATSKGARLIVGGKRHAAGELFYQPTLIADVPGRRGDHARGNLRARRRGNAVRHGRRGAGPRQRQRIRPRRLSRDEGCRANCPSQRRARNRNGGCQPGEDHRRARSLRRGQAIGHRQGGLAPWPRSLHRHQIRLPRHGLRAGAANFQDQTKTN